jgi:ribosomal protein L40E
MAMLIKLLLALAAVAFIAYPFLRPWSDEEDVELPEELEELYRHKESTYSALKELEFDFRTGKLSEGDYAELEAKYKADAVEILQAISEAEKEQTKSKGKGGARKTAASAGASSANRGKAKAAVAATAAANGAGRKNRVAPEEDLVCLACDHVNPAAARFCAGCGDMLAEQSAVAVATMTVIEGGACGECGATVGPGNRFCGVCGAEVRA